MAADQQTSASTANGGGRSYQVVARRYRPRSFSELLGQEHISQALGNAILAGRVGHAYLFTGARGVGKTSAARIFGKALNCVQGPTPQPCNQCDVCLSIDAGEDVDVLEIDGASNRGIDEIRQLRSNINIRPSRTPYKVYIIDEVHMLTSPAFNALLKTLEEPPDHVKFIFCTTDPEKLPITVLSRCQRFDFSPIISGSIVARLREICLQEGREVEEAGLALLARRASGSMRDSQSLLEQLLAFSGARVTLQDVHVMLGTADQGTLELLVSCLVQRDSAGALAACDQAMQQGIEAGHLAEQLLAYWRDMLVAAVQGDARLALQVDPEGWPELQVRAMDLGPETILAGAQILDQALMRMRQSTHARILLEMALVRVAQLQQLDDLATVIQQIRQGGAPSLASGATTHRSPPKVTPPTRTGPPGSDPETSTPGSKASGRHGEKKTTDPSSGGNSVPQELRADRGKFENGGPHGASPSPPTSSDRSPDSLKSLDSEHPPENRSVGHPRVELTSANVAEIWQQALDSLEDMTADFASCAERVAISAPNRLVVNFTPAYNLQKESCERPDRKARIEQALSGIVGGPVTIELRVTGEGKELPSKKPAPSSRHRQRESERHEWVQQAMTLFDAEILRVDAARSSDPATNGVARAGRS